MVCNRNACVYVRDLTKAAVLNGNKILETFYCKAIQCTCSFNEL